MSHSSSYPTSIHVPPRLFSCITSKEIMTMKKINEMVMPSLLKHLSRSKHVFSAAKTDADTTSTNNTTNDIIEEETNPTYLDELHNEIQNDLVSVKEYLEELENREKQINLLIKDLMLLSVKYNMEENNELIMKQLAKIKEMVTQLRSHAYFPTEKFSTAPSGNSRPSLGASTAENSYSSVVLTGSSSGSGSHQPADSTSSDIEKIQSYYENMDEKFKPCLLCFSIFPDNATVKRMALINWWIGEGFIDSTEEQIDEFLKELQEKGFVEFISEKYRSKPNSCKMLPSIRSAVIDLAERGNFAAFRGRQRMFLLNTEGEIRHSSVGNLSTVFNVNQRILDSSFDWASYKNLEVLQLGRWQSSALQQIVVRNSDFFNTISKLENLRLFSVQGVSRIQKLSDISNLHKLVILDVRDCPSLIHLTDDIGSLKLLTYLDISECYSLLHMPAGIPSLERLQVFKGFVIGAKTKKGQMCRLCDLVGLKKLRKLSIYVKTEALVSIEDLESSSKFQALESLTITWINISPTSEPAGDTVVRNTNLAMEGEKIANFLSLENSKKLDLRCIPWNTMPKWLDPKYLKKLEKLYIRGGELRRLDLEGENPWTVKILRLRFLKGFQMHWSDLQVLFPNLIYLEKTECPELSSIPCDNNGIWTRQSDKKAA